MTLTINDEKYMTERVWRQPKTKPEEVEAEVAKRLAAQAANAETVNHPAHYNQIEGIECIDVVKHFGFVTGNIIKYAWRAGLKSEESKLDDLRKCLWYAQLAVEMEEAHVQGD